MHDKRRVQQRKRTITREIPRVGQRLKDDALAMVIGGATRFTEYKELTRLHGYKPDLLLPY